MIPENYLMHGGDIYTRPVRLDFSANINPLGPPKAAIQALTTAASPTYAQAYPDPQCRKLTAALAEYIGVKPEHILCTAGASDFITRIVNAVRPRCALVCAPCFSGYERALASTSTRVKRHMLQKSESFALTERMLNDITSDVELVMLCSPNNPTGLTIEMLLIERILGKARETGALVMLDETFLGFTDAPSARSLLKMNPHLVIVDALTKLYALAGVRVGFGMCTNKELLGSIERAGAEWAVSTAAQMAGVAALSDARFVERTRTFVARSRAKLAHDLRTLGCTVIPGEANYLLFQVPNAAPAIIDASAQDALGSSASDVSGSPALDTHASSSPAHATHVPSSPAHAAPDIFFALLERGILIRPCAGYCGLDNTWYRVAVRTLEENDQLISALKEVIL